MVANIIQTDFICQKTEWIGQRITSSKETYTLEQALAQPELQRVCWDGRQSKIIEDSDGLPLIVMGRHRLDFDGRVVERLEQKLIKADEALDFTPMKRKPNSRGSYDAAPMGGSFGGGQKCPAMFAHTDCNGKIIQLLCDDPDMQRIARLCDHEPKLSF
ncbi:hypothetical protein FB446DRAFT_795445 [Lentinula raphanica]|nr:hypothetical protein FB446DRAFT_795445 [Lentinula raphanica]